MGAPSQQLSTDGVRGRHERGARPHTPHVSTPTSTHLWSHLDPGHEVFSRAAALAAGESDASLARALRAGVIVRLRRGMYVASAHHAAADDVAKHLLLARAAIAAQRGEVVLTGASAAALYGFALYHQDLSTVHLLRLDRGSSHRAASANHHRVVDDVLGEIGEYAGLLAVSPARAVWEVACRSTLEAGVVTADSALRLDPTIAAPLEEFRDRFAHVRGSRTARTAIRLADGRSDSPGESVCRVQFLRYDIPSPDLQYRAFDHLGRRVGDADFYWEDARHLGEFDGKIKYQKLLRPGESASECVVREKRREDAMRADLRGMTRFVWADVMPDRARRTMFDLARSLEQSRRLYVHGRVVIAS